MAGDTLLAHRHGASPDGTPVPEGVLDFSVNLAPVAPPFGSLSLPASVSSAYPSIDGGGVRAFYASRFGIDPDCVLALNGASEGIYLVPRAFRLKRVLVLQPSFFDYSRACRLADAEVVPLRLAAANGFAFPGSEVLSEALAGCDGFFCASPNNPTGTMIPGERLLDLAAGFPKTRFIVDESFIQFTEGFPGNALLHAVSNFRNVVVIHSLTKFYAVAGLRMGAIIAHPDAIRALYGHKEPWTVSAAAELAAGLLQESAASYEHRVGSLVAQGRRMVLEELSRNPAFELHGGSANFFLAGIRDCGMLGELLAFLRQRNILVRDCRNFDGLAPKYFRFCIRTPEENRHLLSALAAFADIRQEEGVWP